MQEYNHTNKLFLNQEVDLNNMKVMLVNGYTFAATETGMTAANAAEVSGNGWTAGGELVSTPTVTVANTTDARLDGDDISKTATGGSIGPVTGYVLYDATNNTPLSYHEYSSAQTALEGAPFVVNWNDDGIYVVAKSV